MDKGIENLEKVLFNVDFVLTHTCPSDVFPYVVNNDKTNGELERYLNFVSAQLNNEFNWYFGHFHKDMLGINGKYNCLYKKIVRII